MANKKFSNFPREAAWAPGDIIAKENAAGNSRHSTYSDLLDGLADEFVGLTGGTMAGALEVPTDPYSAVDWNDNDQVPTKGDVRDALEAARVTIDTDGTMAADSDLVVPSQKAVRTYVASAVTGLLEIKGSTDCSGNPNYPAASKGDAYLVSVAGRIGGGSGKLVDMGDWYVAVADNAGGTEGAVGTSWAVLEHNLNGLLVAANNLSDLASPSTARTNLGATTVGANLLTISDPSAVRFLRINADNTVSELDAADFRTAIGAGGGTGDLLAANNLSDVANAGTSRTNLGGTTVGQAFFVLANPGAVTFPRVNADNSVTLRTAAQFRGDIGAGTGTGDLVAANNLSDVADASTARTNLGVDYTTLAELIRDTIGTALVAGTNMTVTVNDAGDTITLAASGGGSGNSDVANHSLCGGI